MKKYLLFILLTSANLLHAQVVNDKLVAYFPWGVDCKGDDAANNGSFATPVPPNGGPICVCGVQDQAIRFDGVDDGVLFLGTLNDVFAAGDFSISFSIKPAPISGTQLVMSKSDGCTRKNAFWVRYSHATRTISSGISETDSLLVTVSGKLDPDPCWQYIVISRNFKTYNIYINGALRDSKTSSERIDITNTALFNIGEKVCPNLDKNFKGELDELRVYKKALSQEEINTLNLRPDNIFNRDTLVYLGDSFQTFITNTCAAEFEWQPSTGVADPKSPSTIITPTAPTTYRLTFKHADCIASDTIFVNVIDPDSLDCDKIFIPNAFVPGGVNKVFGISNPVAARDFISMEIYDRWGGRMYNFSTENDTWDGTFDGKNVNAGIYLYRLRYRCDGEEKTKAGTVTLIR